MLVCEHGVEVAYTSTLELIGDDVRPISICPQCSEKALAELVKEALEENPAVVYLREVDAGTDNACWIVCAKGDPGSIRFVAQEK